jgi:hypothetical protein
MRKHPDLRRNRTAATLGRDSKSAVWRGGPFAMTIFIGGHDGKQYSCTISREEALKWITESDPKLDLVRAHTPKLGYEWVGPRAKLPKGYVLSATPLLPV